MKRKLLTKLAIISTLLMFLTTSSFAQTGGEQPITLGIPEIALVQAADSLGNLNGPVSLELTTTVAGTQISGGHGTTYLQVSSIIGTGVSSIQAAITSGTVPAGTTLHVRGKLPVSGNDGGATGTAGADVTLSATAQDVITNVGSCYTGTATGDGYQMIWDWVTQSAATYGSIVGSPTSTPITVTFTIATTGS